MRVLVVVVAVALSRIAVAQPDQPGALDALDYQSLVSAIQRMCSPGGVAAHNAACGTPPSALNVSAQNVSAQWAPIEALKAAGVDICGLAGVPNAEPEVKRVCGGNRAAGVSVVVSALMCELGTYAKTTAEQQVIDYVFDKVLTSTCTQVVFERKTGAATVVVRIADLLVKTCTTKPTDALTLQSLVGAVKDDVYHLPAKVAEVIGSQLTFTAEQEIVIAAAAAMYQLARGESPINLFEKARQYALDKHLTCDLSVVDLKCVALLALSVGDSVAHGYKNSLNPINTDIVEKGAQDFCAKFATPTPPDLRTCLTNPVFADATVLEQMRQLVVAMSAVAIALAHGNNEGRGLAELAIRDVIQKFEDLILKHLSAKQKNDVDAAVVVLDAATHLVTRDAAALRQDAAKLIRYVSAKLSDKEREVSEVVVAGVSLVAVIVASPSDVDVGAMVKTMFAPKGTYKIKYGREKTTISLNTLVGPSIAYQWHPGNGTNTDDAAYRFSIPIGIDVALPGDSVYLAFGVNIADALGNAVVDKNNSISKASSYLYPGAYLRLGLFGSPFSIVTTGGFRPGIAGAMDCTKQCDGAWEAGLSLAVDVPLLILR